VIVGAGLFGICAGIQCKQAGIPFVILEKNDTPGGTWFENDYPGCGVDIPNYFYSYSFFTDFPWTRHFSQRDELLAYLQAAVDRYGIREHIRFKCAVTQLRWDEQAQHWNVDYHDAEGRQQNLQGNAVLSAVGQLNRPAIPNIPGLSNFKGPAFHTARWRNDVNLRDKRVVMIGTGASGVQVGPTIAPEVAKLTVLQRTPHWVFYHPNYHKEISAGLKWAMKNIPFYAQWYRFTLFWAASDGLHPSLRVDSQWAEPGSVSALNKELRQRIEAYVRQEVGDDPALLAKVLPDYPPYGKRMLRDNHWFRMLKRPNVELVTSGIERITANAVEMKDGTVHPADVLILATGFEAGRMLAPMDVRGRGGVSIREVWGEDNPRAYLGITAPGFPNLFMAYGPNTNLVHGGSIFFQAECQVHYMMEALRELIERGYSSLEVRPEVHDAYNERVDAACRDLAWGQLSVKNWYQNEARRVFANSPWRLVDYWRMTHTFNPSEYTMHKSQAALQAG
ncbi:MAG: NAD(P)/FAD-dependent oxidoreductase, partial [Pusillimonas sp.]|nr:NAD(P)/FAD-dependent oxidoreductase [Pusillimonas sp.]